MKRLAAYLLLAILSVACFVPAYAQVMTAEQNARRSRKAANKQQKMLKKANKKQRKAMNKYQKKQRKATKKANKDLEKRRAG